MSTHIKSASRILYIIQFLNQENGVTANQMSMATQISRAATYRMLETLRSLGFVRKETDGRYWLEPQILSLASGYIDDKDLSGCLLPILHELSEQTGWPISVSTRANNSMVIRASTDLESATAARRRLTAGWPMPGLLNSAAGIVYLAFSDRETRNRLLDLIAAEDKDCIRDSSSRREIEEMLDGVSGRGYANITHTITWNWVDRTSAIGVPIFNKGRLYGALSMRYFQARITKSDAEEQFLKLLSDGAKQVELSLAKTIGKSA